MSIRIPLPNVSRTPDSKAHPFPLQIAFQTQEFLQGSLFYAMLADIAAGEYVRQPQAAERLKQKMISEGLAPDAWESGWKYLERYKPVFERFVFQNVLISIRSHWDWYVRQLGGFVVFARKHVPCSSLSTNNEKALENIAFKELLRQLDVLEQSCDLSFAISSETRNSLEEMAFVRNLGLHNRWEVDQRYKKQTKSRSWEIGEFRTFSSAEVQAWHQSLLDVISVTSIPIAKRFVQAPSYP